MRAIRKQPWWALVRHRVCVLSSVLLLAYLGTGTAQAATDQERAGARAAATAGADAFDAEKYQQALDLFQRAQSLVHSPVHLSYIGRCQVKLGMLVEARETFLKLKREQVDDDTHEAVKRAVAEAATLVEQVEPRLPYLAIKVSGAEPGEAVSVTVDGKPIAPALVGIATPANPGEHIVRATAAGKDSGEVKVTLAEGQRQELVVTLLATESAAPTAPMTQPSAGESAGGQSAGQSAEGPVTDQGTGGDGFRVPAYVAFGLGAVGLGFGTYFALDAGSAADEADELCGGSRESCTLVAGATRQEVEDKNDQAGQSRTLAIVGFALGGVGVAAGVTLLVLSMDGSSESPQSTASVMPYAGPSEIGLVGYF